MSGSYDTEVLIVGAGPAGLSLATELTMRGVTVIVVEQNERVGVQPRAKTTNVRTMEHMRRWGLAAKVRSLSPIPAEVPRRVRFATSLFGGDIWLFENSSAPRGSATTASRKTPSGFRNTPSRRCCSITSPASPRRR